MKYKIEVVEHRKRVYKVEADSEDEAMHIFESGEAVEQDMGINAEYHEDTEIFEEKK